jgi:lauroyl/myristoyl acyltransferase
MKGSTLTRNSGKAVMTGNTANAPPAGRAAGKESAPVKTITMTDVAVALGLPLMAAIAWLAPARSWRIFSRLVSPFYAPALATNPLPTVAERMARVVAERPIDGAPEDLIRDLVEEDILSLIELLRDYRFDRWTPPIEVRGLENVEAARQRGRGAILWVSHFVHCDLVAKMGFHRAGLEVSHLSHPRHGFSGTRFGMRFLNRVHTAIEDRYLRKRVRLSLESSAPALEELRQRLDENGVVSISVRGDSRRPVRVPFLDGEIPIAAGAPSLAFTSGAALLPVFPVRDSSGGFTVFIDAPIEIDQTGDRREAVVRISGVYAKRLESYALKYPGQWIGWFHL